MWGNGSLPTSYAGPNTARSTRCWVMWGLIAAVYLNGWCGLSEVYGASHHVPSFSETHRSYRKLSTRVEGTREEWLRVIDAFAALHRAHRTSQTGKRSLFLAGRSCLLLYRQSGRSEDIDRALTFLNEFVRTYRKGRDLIEGLQELKEAYLMKRGMKGPLANKQSVEASPCSNLPNPSGGSSSSPILSDLQHLSVPAHHSTTPQPPPLEAPRPCSEDTPPPRSPQAKEDREHHKNEGQGHPHDYKNNPPLPPSGIPSRTACLTPSSVNDMGPSRNRKSETEQTLVIVIDPGHGGKDPGAISPDGQLKEKDVTLAIACRVRDILQKNSSFITVHLTRSDDRTMSLKERTNLANKLNADLFVSIHCNAAEDTTSKGVETYYLSKASSAKAMAVAARENGIPLAKMNDLEATLLDLVVTSKKTESVRLATAIHSALMNSLAGIAAPQKDRGVRRGPFYVLFGAKMPAILVECGFINNRREKTSLNNEKHLEAIAQGIASGIHDYFKDIGNQG